MTRSTSGSVGSSFYVVLSLDIGVADMRNNRKHLERAIQDHENEQDELAREAREILMGYEDDSSWEEEYDGLWPEAYEEDRW